MSDAVAAPFSRLLSDERLTRRAVGGDERAFAAIFRRYHQSLYRFCLAIVGNPEDAQDALQNTMIKVLRALPGEERRIDLKPWLYRIAHNEAIDLLRRRRETRELDVEQVAPGYGLAEDAAARERLRRLLADLKDLPERQREVVVMRELSGLGFGEIAGALETSAAVARQTLYEARQSLRQMEEGREMSCARVTQALSDGDGRVSRRRDIRAHLRNCAKCQAFRKEIKSRQRDLAALPPLPAMAAAGMLHGLLGGSQGATAGGGLATTLGGGAAKTIGASAAAKGVATAAVVAAIGVTAADRSGVIHLGLPGERPTKSAEPAAGQLGSSSARDGGARIGRDHSVGAVGGSAQVASGRSRASFGGGMGEAKHPPALTAASRRGDAAAHGPGHHVPEGQLTAEEKGPQPQADDHPSGRSREERYSEATGNGQAAAVTHKAPQERGAGDAGAKSAGHAAMPTPPPHSAPASSANGKGPPAAGPSGGGPVSPPAAAPEPSLPSQGREAKGVGAPESPPDQEAPPGKAR